MEVVQLNMKDPADLGTVLEAMNYHCTYNGRMFDGCPLAREAVALACVEGTETFVLRDTTKASASEAMHAICSIALDGASHIVVGLFGTFAPCEGKGAELFEGLRTILEERGGNWAKAQLHVAYPLEDDKTLYDELGITYDQ